MHVWSIHGNGHHTKHFPIWACENGVAVSVLCIHRQICLRQRLSGRLLKKEKAFLPFDLLVFRPAMHFLDICIIHSAFPSTALNITRLLSELKFMWSFLSTWTEAESTKLNFLRPGGEVEHVKRINTFKTGRFLLRSTYFICFFLGSNWFLLSYTQH